jgi:hypothetical protein
LLFCRGKIEETEKLYLSQHTGLAIKALFSPGPWKAFMIPIGVLIFQVFCEMKIFVSTQIIFVYKDG